MKKRVLSVLLVLAMCLSLLPTAVFATDAVKLKFAGDDEAVNAEEVKAYSYASGATNEHAGRPRGRHGKGGGEL